ncbi:unnamed protein product [Adineta steineri]|uniref:Poly [ADP-ribose] polymerase n=1 Tax=Adineta steineri TaxID=433720 RepID=A0A818NXV8_9BILA|nr:unnamed protein product [Adineta steineri]CAF3612524.1 unnamed protein product [Adineta steineri]
MTSCSNFTPHLFKKDTCRDCFQTKDKHIDLEHSLPTESSSTNISSRKSFPNDNNNIQLNQSSVHQNILNQENKTDTANSRERTPESWERKPCPYGLKCCSTSQNHFDNFSHPLGFQVKQTQNTLKCQSQNTDQEKTPCLYGLICRRRNPDHFEKYSHPVESNIESQSDNSNSPSLQENFEKQLQLVEKRFLASIADLQNKNEYYEQEIEKLRQDKIKMAEYHLQLENDLALELDERERRESKKLHVYSIQRKTPNYWGINAFEVPYREINIRQESGEFTMINDLFNSTIGSHGNQFGTIYGKDPTEFIVTNIKRIHNDKLWHEYCFKKDSIMNKTNNRLMEYESSKYFEDRPLLTPLLDASANEYWLFHGCDRKILPILLHDGYDPRVSSITGMFGGGFYLAENSSKSNQYIACPSCEKNCIFRGRGCSCKNQNDLQYLMIVYRALLGDVHRAMNYDETIYRGQEEKKPIRRPPLKDNSCDLYDSVMGESKTYGGNRLEYREFILYESGQAYPEYVIQYKRSATNAHPPSDTKNMINKCRFFLQNRFNLRRE